MPELLLGMVGDVLVNRPNPSEVFEEVKDALAVPDVLFGNLEGPYTDDPQPTPGVIGAGAVPAAYLSAIPDAGFDVLSLANNHILDVGYAAMIETRDRLRAMGVSPCGVGRSLAEAREPAIVQAKGLRIAFLSYASVFPLGYEARRDAPGLAPMRAYNFWRDPYPSIHVPGKLPVVTTVPDETDLTNLAADIALAREQADLVITSFHWGEMTQPFLITDHEKRTAHFCVDHGADLVVGHHHHILRGMEWYRGKPIMYGLGHFVFDCQLPWSADFTDGMLELIPTMDARQNPYATAPRPGWPYLPFHEDSRMTLLAWAQANESGVASIGFLPCHLTADGRVHPLDPGSAHGRAVVEYLEKCNTTQGLDVAVRPSQNVTLGRFGTLEVSPA